MCVLRLAILFFPLICPPWCDARAESGVPLSRLRVELRDYDTGRLPARVYLRDSSGKVWTPTGSITHKRGAEDHFSPLETLSISCLGRWLGRMDVAGGSGQELPVG
jgi:hypothetical protein